MRRGEWRVVWVVGLLAVDVALSALPALAQDQSSEAQSLFQQGLEFSEQERWLDAHTAFTSSARLVARASTFYNLAVCSVELGLGATALGALAQFDALADARQHAEYIQLAAALRARANQLAGTLVLSLSPPDLLLTIDGHPRSGVGAQQVLLLDPGTHGLEASAPGRITQAFEVDIRAQTTQQRRIELAPERVVSQAAPTRSPQAAVLMSPTATERKRSSRQEPQSDGGSFFTHPVTLIVAGAITAGGVATALLLATSGESGGEMPMARAPGDSGKLF